MTIADRIALELRKPSGDTLYASEWHDVDNAFATDAEEWVDATSRLTRAAVHADFRLSNESARAVVSLYRSAATDERTFLEVRLIETISPLNAPIVAAIVVELGLISALHHIPAWQSRALVAEGVRRALLRRPRALTDVELASLLPWAQVGVNLVEIQSASAKVHGIRFNEELSAIEFKRLIDAVEDVQRFRSRREVLHGENLTLERDRRELIDRLSKLEVSPDVRALLDSADRNAATGDYAAGMGKLRTFLERSVEQCCRRHARGIGQDDLPADSLAIGEWAKWAERANLVTRPERVVLGAVANFLSVEGSHSATSQPRQFAVAKATVIEWCLLVADRVE